MSAAVRHSKIQLQVLSLYKSLLRAAKGKPGFDYTIRTEFKKNAVALERSDVLMIEHLMRHGKRKLEMIQDPNVSGMGQFVKDKDE